MILKNVKITNFRLLKEFKLDFACQQGQNLTVIRAANETGKTTILHALQWGIFGDNALPNKGAGYRLSPLDLSGEVMITVEINFDIINARGVRNAYILQRTAQENVSGNVFTRSQASKVVLFKKSSTGVDEIEHAQGWLRPHLPEDLREVFFTDGDRALSFIEGSYSDQTKKVEGAIRSLLGLEIIENAVTHLGQVKTKLTKGIKHGAAESKELTDKAEELTSLKVSIPADEQNLKNSEKSLQDAEALYDEADQKLIDTIRAGDKSKLSNDLDRVRREITAASKSYENATKSQSDLFKSRDLGASLLAKTISGSFKILDNLYNEGVLPNSAVPIMRSRLSKTTCFCGSCIDPDKPEGAKNREAIEHLLQQSEAESEKNRLATDLYYRTQSLKNTSSSNLFLGSFPELMEKRATAQDAKKTAEESHRDIEAHIRAIPDVDISDLRKHRDSLKITANNERSRRDNFDVQLYRDRKKHDELEKETNKLLSSDLKGRQLLSELNVAGDMENLFSNSLKEMEEIELQKVSDLMNEIFLRMIGAVSGAESSGIIQSAEINAQYKIIVNGNSGNILNPSQDLNGASRRALTLAFIMALTKVSEVVAPNVIDTPLGMTSGYVKNSILKLACQNSAQLVMLLTHDEIKGCEDLIDEFGGSVTTITNPTHYPKILLNDPEVSDIRIIQCGCNHRTSCTICERRESEENKS